MPKTRGPVVTACVAAVAMIAVVGAFATNASPYVTVSQARRQGGDHLHLAGDLVKDSVRTDLVAHTLSFQVKDADGEMVTVVHRGDPPGNLSTATKVVAVGKMQGNAFVSDQLLVKCPSKYEGKDVKTIARS